ncbi:MAG: hypothetical protein KC931_25180, partial [Candidatus Omnitrophica bacterium]|nr:hypothetical protein [Candidatus Omnitrophota bacterium]
MSNDDFLTDSPSGGMPIQPTREETPYQPHPARRPERTKLNVSQSRGFTLREVIRLLFKHKWVLILPLLIIPPLGILYANSLPPIYMATARIQIQATELASFLPPESAAANSGKGVLNDQVLLMQSDSMLAALIDDMHLDEIMPLPGGESLERDERVTALINRLRSNVLIISAIPKTRSINITAQWPENKELPMLIANNLGQLYVRMGKTQIEEAAQSFQQTYMAQSESTEEELSKTNQEIERFLKENSVASVEAQMESLMSDLSRIRHTVWNYRNDLISLDVEIESIKEQLS